MSVRYLAFFGLVCCGAINTYAQKHYADSLKNVLAITFDAKARIDLKCEIAYDLYDYADSVAFLYSEQAKEESQKEKYDEGLKRALTMLGLGNYNYGQLENALHNLRASDKIQANIPAGFIGYNLMLIGTVYRDIGKFDSAKYYYSKAINSIGPQGDAYFLAACYANLAKVEMVFWNLTDAYFHLKKAEALALIKPKDYYVVLNVWNLYVEYYLNTNDYQKARVYQQKLCNQSAKTKDYYHQTACLLKQVDLAIYDGHTRSALNTAFEALKISDIFRHPQQRIVVYTQIGNIYTELSEYALASKYYFEALKIGRQRNLNYETAMIYSELAWINKELFNFTLALEYLDKSQDISISIGDRSGVSKCMNIRGLVLFMQKKYDKAITEFDKSLQIRKAIDNKAAIAATMYNMGLLYQALNENEKAFAIQQEATRIEESINHIEGLGLSYNVMAHLLMKLNRLKEAERYLEQANDLARSLDSKILKRNLYETRSYLAEKRGDLARALQFERRYREMNDSIYSESGSIKLAEMETLYQLEEKEKRIQEMARLENQREEELGVQKALAERQRIIIGISAFAIVLLIFAGGIGYQYYQAKNEANLQLRKLNRDILEQKEEIQAQSEELLTASNTISSINKALEIKIEERTYELKQAYKELDTFFYRSSHDFRRPITTFLGLAGVAAITVKDPVSLELFDKVKETATNLDKMLQKLQSISDLGAQQMVFKEVFLKELVDEVLDSFRENIQLKKIAVHVELNETATFSSYPVLVKLILDNLVENAIHFAGFESPFIKVLIKVDETQMELVVEDNGQGISEQYQSRVFEMYFRASDRSKGNGLGLYISKKAVERLGGWIGFSSERNKGSVFLVRIPNNT